MIELLSIYFPYEEDGINYARVFAVVVTDRHFDPHLDRDCPDCRGSWRWRVERDYR